MHRIAVIPGDGVGPEVVEIGLRVLSVAAAADPEAIVAALEAHLPPGGP